MGEQLEAAEESLQVARQRAGIRFPALLDAPLNESRACQHERTLTWHYVLDHHPENPRAWIAGGGSGHGFKQAPAVGEMLARAALDGNARLILIPPQEGRDMLGNALAKVEEMMQQCLTPNLGMAKDDKN